ncbi:hypothetical protein J5834_01765 [bacterium]|nr:hypothetical protein [bacterium]
MTDFFAKFYHFSGRALAVLFIASIPLSLFFWHFVSDSGELDPATEEGFAKVLNENFKEGDIIFPENDWDLDFTKKLNNKIFPVYLSLKELKSEDFEYLKEDDGRVFFLLNDPGRVETLLKKLKLREIRRFDVPKGLVLLAEDAVAATHKLLVFSRDIDKAREVYFTKKDEKRYCRLNSGGDWICAKNNWNYVGRFTAKFNGRIPERAVWAHPLSKENLNIVFDLPQGSRHLVFNSVLREAGWMSPNKAPVHVTVFADETKILEYKNESVRNSFRHKAEIPQGAKTLRIVITTNDDRQRHFTFNGYVAP